MKNAKTYVDLLLADPTVDRAKIREAGQYAEFLANDMEAGYAMRRVDYRPDGPDPTNRLFASIERHCDNWEARHLFDVANYIADRLKPRPTMSAAA